MQPTKPARFSFVDEGEAVRRLGISRDALLSLVESKRLRAYPGVGKGSFFRVSDLDALAAELRPAPPPAPAGAVPITLGGLGAGRKEHDPAMKVHLRLQADLKWLDLKEEELHAWVRELHPAAYEKNRGNLERVIALLSHLRELLDTAAEAWDHKPDGAAAASATEPTER
ncbi:MAG: hypothetical protein IVW57_10155 [Ktedonobacterales bacterium]|nr:hypothetical protein [Ktedonobacterales bacterium]